MQLACQSVLRNNVRAEPSKRTICENGQPAFGPVIAIQVSPIGYAILRLRANERPFRADPFLTGKPPERVWARKRTRGKLSGL